jgi:superfamily II DNA/RNA helicase
MSLKNLETLVFDEADRMLSMGFYPDMRRVQGYLPDRRVSTYMFSATFPPQVIRLAQGFMKGPGFLNLSSDHIHVTETEHLYYDVPAMDKDRSLVRILEVENPPSALIFCNTKARVDYVTAVLQRFWLRRDELTSDLPQATREKVLGRVRKETLRFLVATDVAARGIDLPELSHVIQYEPPEDPEAYIHRAGRTGRAGGSGTAITLVSAAERSDLLRIGRRFSIDFQERPTPSDEDVEMVVSERVIALLEARLRGRDRLQAERMERFLPLARSLVESEDESGLLAMLLDDFYQETFYAPVVPPQEEQLPCPAPVRCMDRKGRRDQGRSCRTLPTRRGRKPGQGRDGSEERDHDIRRLSPAGRAVHPACFARASFSLTPPHLCAGDRYCGLAVAPGTAATNDGRRFRLEGEDFAQRLGPCHEARDFDQLRSAMHQAFVKTPAWWKSQTPLDRPQRLPGRRDGPPGAFDATPWALWAASIRCRCGDRSPTRCEPFM